MPTHPPARSRKGCTPPRVANPGPSGAKPKEVPTDRRLAPRTVRHKPNCNCDFNGFQKSKEACRLQYIRPLVRTRNTVARSQRGQPTGRWPHEPCVTNQIAFVTPMVFKRDPPTVMNSSLGAYPETQRREAKGADRPTADPTNRTPQIKWHLRLQWFSKYAC